MKKLTWKKKMYQENEADDFIVWTAKIKPIGWEFSIEKNACEGYKSYVYYGIGDDIPILNGFSAKSLKEAQNICNNWLQSTILGLNKWI